MPTRAGGHALSDCTTSKVRGGSMYNGCIASRAGGLYSRELCGRIWLYSLHHFSIRTFHLD
jgi:hypothetical protein